MKTAIIIGVGPNRGLGAQLCKRFAADGLKVIVAGRTKPTVEAVAKDIASSGGQAIPIVADATNEADTVALFDCAGTEVDLAIYNAGNNTPRRYGRAVFRKQLARRVLRWFPVWTRGHPANAAEKDWHPSLHGGQRLAPRPRRIWSIQFV